MHTPTLSLNEKKLKWNINFSLPLKCIMLLNFLPPLFLPTHAQTISTIAGNGSTIDSGDGGPATAAGTYFPWSLNTDAYGNIYMTGFGNGCVRKINITTGIITTVAGADTFEGPI